MILWIITWDISNNGIINYRIKCIQEIKQWVIIRGFKYISIRDLTLVMGTLKWVVCKCHVMGLKKYIKGFLFFHCSHEIYILKCTVSLVITVRNLANVLIYNLLCRNISLRNTLFLLWISMIIELWRCLKCVKLSNDCNERKAFKYKKSMSNLTMQFLNKAKSWRSNVNYY